MTMADYFKNLEGDTTNYMKEQRIIIIGKKYLKINVKFILDDMDKLVTFNLCICPHLSEGDKIY